MLRAVSTVSETAAWAVGARTDRAGPPQLIARWNGKAWSAVTHPFEDGHLYGVDAVSDDDVWIVGWKSSVRPLIAHWDGTQWRESETPVPNGYGEVVDVSALSTDDVWAVANQLEDEYGEANLEATSAFLLHWDGERWAATAELDSEAYRVSAAATDDVWVMSSAFGDVAARWDGRRWRPTPFFDGSLEIVDATAEAAWATAETDTSSDLLEHADVRWQRVPIDLPSGGRYWGGVALSVTPDGGSWIVGEDDDDGLFIKRACPTP